ncbi:hypothetical protein FisN_17Hh002 [Fistulifera solaris]|uniref:UVR domain-containing protein n=1 Tax=Fistulifera solaris TaxID=1519565 RepID=A0A1Z5K926_FISSO|nr:hypothetical protein FisN_17Hh002 [Fistulifera solaris]|eukprot:GAX22621.1 hypothetical protein FisN_17Hh002 [Fistulifera solaris]
MFGGLDLKGKESDKKESSSDGLAHTASTSSSAFSFLNSSSSQPTSSAPQPSPFPFLSSTEKSSPAPANIESSSTQTVSAFNFLSQPQPPTPETNEALEHVAATSSFSFLQRPTTQDDKTTDRSISEGASLPSPSTFSVIGSTDVELTPTVAGDEDILGSMNTSGQSSLAGAGVAFGKATVAPVVKKKRTTRARTAKVGVAAATMDESYSRPSIPEIIPVPAPAPTAPPVDLAAASEASRKAEQFIHSKMIQETSNNPPDGGSLGSESFSNTIGASRSVDSQDEMVQAAKAAVAEAKQLEKTHRSFGGALGGLFRPRNSDSSSSAVSLQLSRSSSHRPSARSPTPTQQTMLTASRSVSIDNAPSTDHTEMTPAELLQREQEEVQRAIAERQLNMMRSTKIEDSVISHLESSSRPVEGFPVSSLMKKPPIVASSTALSMKQTPTSMFNDMMKNFRSKVVASMEEVTNLRKQRAMLTDQRFVTLAKERLAIQEKEQAEAQQTEAAEAEDFELADRMQSIITIREHECKEHASVLNSIGEAIRQLDFQKQQVVDEVSKCFLDIKKDLQSFKEKQELLDREDASETLKRFETISKKISAEQERLDQDLKHMERDEKLVDEESKELEKSISEQTGEYEKQRDAAKDKLGETEKEIEELRKLLTAKQAIAAELRTEIAGHDESILMVRVKFQRQLDRVTKKKNTIKDNREEWEMEKRANDKQKEEHDRKVKAHSEELLAHDKLMTSLSSEIDMADTFGSIVAKEMNFGVSEEEEEKIDGELMQLQAAVVDAEARLTERKETLAASNSQMLSLEEEILSLKHLIPQYEEQKKEAAARRDFKAAGKASKDAKDAVSRLKDCEEELSGEARFRKESAEEDVRRCQSELEEMKAIAHEKEKESGMAAMRRLAENVKRFIATKSQVCGDADANSIRGVGAYVLDGQIKLLVMEGKAYDEKYGGWDDLIGEFHPDQPDSAKAQSQCVDSSASSSDKTDPESLPTAEANASAGRSADVHIDCTKSPLAKEIVYRQFQELTTQLREIEEKIEVAVASEDFDAAAEYEENMQSLLLKLGTLNLSEEEMEVALALPPSSEKLPADGGDETSFEQPADNAEESNEEPSHVATENSGDNEEVTAKETSDMTSEKPGGESPEDNGDADTDRNEGQT